MYLVVIGVLSAVLAFPQPVYHWVTGREATLTAVALATVVPVIVALLFARYAVRLIDRKPGDPGDGQFWFGRGLMITHVLLGLLHTGVLVASDWSLICRDLPVVGEWPILPASISILPFLISILLVWVASYPADRAVRQIALEVYLFRGRPVRPVWPLGEYIAYNLRHQVLFILIPLLLILTARDLIELYEDQVREVFRHHFAPDLLLGTAAGAVAVFAPVIVRHVWVTQRLPDGPLRDRMQALCKKLRVRYREILVWRSGGMIVNAAVMGVIAPLRYVLITDAMLEQMEDSKIEAVFGHEVGHVKRHHILFYLLFVLVSGCLITVFSVYTRKFDPTTYQIVATVGGALLILKWGLVFGWISRRFERQADLYSARVLPLTGLPCSTPCALHGDPDTNGEHGQRRETDRRTALRGDRICATSAHVFADSLHEVAHLNGIQPEARSWRHSSIASRSRFLQSLARDPAQARRFERSVFYSKLVIFLAAVGTSLWAAWAMRIWTLLGLG